MKCPNCGSENCQYITTTETHGKGFSASNACCGSILLGPLGVLCLSLIHIWYMNVWNSYM